MSLPLKPEDRPAPAGHGDHDDTAIAIEIAALGEMEADLLMMNGFVGEARQAVRAALGLIESPSARRLLHRAQRANDDAIKRGLALVERARSL